MKSAFDIAESYLKHGSTGGAEAATVDPTEGEIVAVLIDSAVLGAPIWFALSDGWRPDPGDTTPVFYASELPALCTKTAAELRSMFNVKRAFGGGMARQ